MCLLIWQRKDDIEPEIDVEDEIRKLVLSLCNEELQAILNLVQQFKQIAAGTHKAMPIQAPNIKQNTKGRPSLFKKAGTTLTKRNPSAFEIVKAKLKKKSMKRAANTQRQKTKQVKHQTNTSDDSDGVDESNYKNEDKEYKNEESKGEDKEQALANLSDNAAAQPNDIKMEKDSSNSNQDGQ
ncbi:hypothetical protein PCANC_00352 [Puccinia coronata f. sp. avenae]|uniref:Uncharacterized protein n=1 Tax=Puccinia coronata f. sp. avenae TaxID=200324 RepID=A0A2N5W9E2_9BASI|nr:hypothetical protein PCANC_00352 [Puccinia coronata f. sp. avenae]